VNIHTVDLIGDKTEWEMNLVQKIRSPGFDLALKHLKPQITRHNCLARLAFGFIPFERYNGVRMVKALCRT
jgi:hypothetical protein